ncbi:mechanosensitive ion channel family protein [Stieleria varia]|uniref:Small-conductance mechanosensitive channel n=1 Tax=Stieleria varia TaxID=2528005 RepID=A0A5C5ZWK4_9BACT|nr:mechanosensitive ion channel domain-containing protein [Stieleria varia]TWT91540.1 Small-conductance mechanosensitive channel [Stieleria varia]
MAEPTVVDPLVVDPSIAAGETDVLVNFGDAANAAVHGKFDLMGEWMMGTMLPNMVPAAVGLALVFVGYFVAKYVSRVVSQPLRKRVDETLGRFVGTVLFYTIMGGVIASVASKLGAPLGGLAALLAAAGFAIGLAFQGTLSNFAAGVLMIVFRPFKVGDMISVAGVTGKVNEIDLFNTTLDTTDNRRLILPNSSISGGTIENMSYHPHRRVEVLVGVDYEADLNATRHALQTAVDTFLAETIQGAGRGSAVVLAGLGESSVDWKVRMWVATGDYWRMMELLTGEVKQQLDAVGIKIPYPQMDVHLNRIDVAGDVMPAPNRPRVRPTRRDLMSESTSTSGRSSLPYAS